MFSDLVFGDKEWTEKYFNIAFDVLDFDELAACMKSNVAQCVEHFVSIFLNILNSATVVEIDIVCRKIFAEKLYRLLLIGLNILKERATIERSYLETYMAIVKIYLVNTKAKMGLGTVEQNTASAINAKNQFIESSVKCAMYPNREEALLDLKKEITFFAS
jgi:hypothetical protein